MASLHHEFRPSTKPEDPRDGLDLRGLYVFLVVWWILCSGLVLYLVFL